MSSLSRLNSLQDAGLSPELARGPGAEPCWSLSPQARRPCSLQLSGTASASCVPEPALDGSTRTPVVFTARGAATPLHNWTYARSANAPARVDCGALNGAFSSGSLSVRISQ